MANESFHKAASAIKAAIEAATTNKQLRVVLKPLQEQGYQLANRVADTIPGTLSLMANPIGRFMEFYAPRKADADNAWHIVESSLAHFKAFLKTIPNTDTPIEPTKSSIQTEALSLMATLQTIGTFRGVDGGQWEQAYGAFLSDIANAPGIFAKHLSAAITSVTDNVLAPVAGGVARGVGAILWAIVRSLWWVLLLAVIVWLGFRYVPFYAAKLAGKVVPNVA